LELRIFSFKKRVSNCWRVF